MKILMPLWVFYPHPGGVEKHVYKVSQILLSQGHQVRLFTFKHEDGLATRENMDGIEIYRFERNNPAWWERKRVAWWFIRNQEFVDWADVIHSQGFFSWDWAFPWFRALWGNKRMFMTFHGAEHDIKRGALEFPPQKRIVRYRRTAAAVTQGNISVGDYIPKWYGTPYTFLSYGAVDRPPVEPPVPKEQTAVFIRRLDDDTGILMYIEALKILREEQGFDLPLDVYGEGPLRGEVEQKIEQYRLGKVRLHGWISDGDRYPFPARLAFTGGYLSMLEAMIKKRLIIAAYPNDMVKDYLLSLPDAERMIIIAGTAEELAQKLAWALRKENEEETRAMIDRAYRFASAQTWERVVDLYLQLWGVRPLTSITLPNLPGVHPPMTVARLR